jgi:hypothetical protein
MAAVVTQNSKVANYEKNDAVIYYIYLGVYRWHQIQTQKENRQRFIW